MKDFTRHPYLVRRNSQVTEKRRFGRKLLALIPAVLMIVIFWPWITEFSANFSNILQNTPTGLPGKKEVTTLDSHGAGFDELLETALRSERKGDRQAAHRAFQSLLRGLAVAGVHNQRSAAVLPQAASFYRKGDELSPAKVENLYLGALESIQRVHGDTHYDYETIHWGLEKLYLSLNRFDEAVHQTRLLLNFYQRYYPDESTLLAFAAPATVRLGHNLMKAGRNTEARDAYLAAMEMWRSLGQPISFIEPFVEATYLPAKPESNSIGAKKTTPDTRVKDKLTNPHESAAASIENLKAAIEALTIDGVTVEQITEDDRRVTITGFAEDNRQIAAYLRLLKSQVSEPELNLVQSGSRQQKSVNEFSIRMNKI